MPVTLRKMLPADLAEVLSVLARWNMAPVEATADVPDPERSRVEVANTFVAVDGPRIVGVGSYLMLSEGEAETASLAVHPDYLGAGVGYRLQKARLLEMRQRGVRRVRTEADRPQTIKWYINKFCYRVVGRNRKKHAFSLGGVDYWTVLELDLGEWAFRGRLIINAALTGVVPTKADNPSVPLTPREIAADALRVYRLGASMVHIHARDEDGLPTPRKEVFREIFARIRDACPDIVIVATTSGRRTRGLEERLEVLGLTGPDRPDMASLTLGSLNFSKEPSVNSPEAIQTLLATMLEAGVRPELEIFEPGMANYARLLVNRGLVGGRLYANIILGSLGTAAATPQDLLHIVSGLPEEVVWAATGVGRFAFGMQCAAMALGGHVRVGLEDSLYLDEDKAEPATNESLVGRVVRVAEALGRPLATPQEVRQILELGEPR